MRGVLYIKNPQESRQQGDFVFEATIIWGISDYYWFIRKPHVLMQTFFHDSLKNHKRIELHILFVYVVSLNVPANSIYV